MLTYNMIPRKPDPLVEAQHANRPIEYCRMVDCMAICRKNFGRTMVA